MKVINLFTIKALKKNKTRTIVTIIGIALSVTMLTAITTTIVSLQKYLRDSAIITTGNWQGIIHQLSLEDQNDFLKNEEIKSSFSLQCIGYAPLENCKNEYKPFLYIGGIDDDFANNIPINLTSGRLPQNSQEIILPSHLKDNGRLNFTLNDTLSLKIGKRQLDNKTLDQSVSFTNDKTKKEEFIQTGTREYTVVGFYQRPDFELRRAAGFTALTKKEDNNFLLSSVFFNVKHPQKFYDFFQGKFDDHAKETNQSLLMSYAASDNSTFTATLFLIAGILIAIIMFGSISLIYNSFSISISERTKQFALLSSIGATKRQLKESVVFEGCLLCLIGIPLGIISGMLGMAVTFKFIGKIFSDIGIGSSEVELTFAFSWLSLLCAAILGFITVLISSYIPARRAMKINTIDAILQTTDIQIKPNELKVSKLTGKLFGFEGIIASKNFKRNKKRYRTTVISLFVSIVLFISATSFSKYLSKNAMNVVDLNNKYDLIYSFSRANQDAPPQEANRIFNLLKNAKDVKEATLIKYYTTASVAVKDSQLNADFLKFLNSKQNIIQFEKHGDEYLINSVINFVDDQTYEQYLTSHGYSKEKYITSYQPLCLITNNFKAQIKDKYYSYNILKPNVKELNLLIPQAKDGLDYIQMLSMEKDSPFVCTYSDTSDVLISMPIDEATKNKQLNVGNIVTDLPLGASVSDFGISIIFPQSYADTFLTGAACLDDFNKSTSFMFTSSNHRQTYADMTTILDNQGVSISFFNDIAKEVQSNKNLVLILNIFSFGFIALISLISLANVFNTISTNINLRRCEFAMLKSVGMTKKGFNKMMNYECILYGAKSLAFGLPIGILVSVLIHNAFSNSIQSPYIFPFWSIIVSIFAVFIIVFTSMIYSMQKVKKDNPIETIRNTNL